MTDCNELTPQPLTSQPLQKTISAFTLMTSNIEQTKLIAPQSAAFVTLITFFRKKPNATYEEFKNTMKHATLGIMDIMDEVRVKEESETKEEEPQKVQPKQTV